MKKSKIKIWRVSGVLVGIFLMVGGTTLTAANANEAYEVEIPLLDNQIIELNLTKSEIKDLIAMLRSLEGEGWQHVKAPTEFPQ